MSRDDAHQGDCKHVNVNEEVTHAVVRPCQNQDVHHQEWDLGCRPIYITVSGRHSTNRCTGQYPQSGNSRLGECGMTNPK